MKLSYIWAAAAVALLGSLTIPSTLNGAMISKVVKTADGVNSALKGSTTTVPTRPAHAAGSSTLEAYVPQK